MTPTKETLASYLPQSTVSATFCNETAARLFAEWWNKEWAIKATRASRKVRLNACEPALRRKFRDQAGAFNAAAEHAAQIAEGGE